MATLMQKDVLIEVIASAMANIYHFENKYGVSASTRNDDVILLKKRSWVYSTSHEEINYPVELKEMQIIRDKYKV